MAELTAGKTVALFAVPGRLHAHLLGQAPAGLQGQGRRPAQAKGVDAIACVSVNDVFVMNAWGKDQKVGDDVLMLADGNGDFAKARGPRTGRLGLRHGPALSSAIR